MRLLVSVVLLLVQLGPLAGAGICLHGASETSRPDADCSMPMDGMPQGEGQTQPGSSQDCAQLTMCAPTAPVVVQRAVQLFGVFRPGNPSFSTPTLLSPGDPIAPPQPPPIA